MKTTQNIAILVAIAILLAVSSGQAQTFKGKYIATETRKLSSGDMQHVPLRSPLTGIINLEQSALTVDGTKYIILKHGGREMEDELWSTISIFIVEASNKKVIEAILLYKPDKKTLSEVIFKGEAGRQYSYIICD
jgi:hypothetical protein